MHSVSSHTVSSRRLVVAIFLAAALVFTAKSAHAQDVAVAADEVAPPPPPPTVVSAPPPAHEQICDDHLDDDRDGLADCADADCFDARACEAGGAAENTEAACRDWLDNDGDGSVDCDDQDCQTQEVRACRGSWSGASTGATQSIQSDDDLPEVAAGGSLEDLVGTNGDRTGESTDEACADGIDNDLDGHVDCADYGCRFDPQVTVCQAQAGGMRFSVVAGMGARLTFNYNADGTYIGNVPEGGITLLQIRAFGQMPGIQNSFFLLSARADDSFRVSFALFQIPISSRGHYLQLNSGSGTLSTNRIISVSRQLLLDPAQYMANAFEQGNGIVLENGGPIDDDGRVRYRLFGAVGSDQFSSSVGGRFFSTSSANFAYTLGGQLQVDFAGHYDRYDNPYLYTPTPLTVAALVGFKYDQLPNERQLAWHALGVFRFWHFMVRAESYTRYVLDFDAAQTAWNLSAAILIVPRVLLFGADVGGFYHVAPYHGLPAGSETPAGVSFQPEQFQYRAALHWFFYRNVAILSLLYSETQREHVATALIPDTERVVRLEARFRF